MGVIATVVLILVLLSIIWFLQESLRYAAYKFYPLVLAAILLAGVFWLSNPREATRSFINLGYSIESVWNSTVREACNQGLGWFCSIR